MTAIHPVFLAHDSKNNHRIISIILEPSPSMISSPLAWKPFPSLLSSSWNSHGLSHDLQPRSKEQERLPAPTTSLISYSTSFRSFPSSDFSWSFLWYGDCHWARPPWKHHAHTPHRRHTGPQGRPFELLGDVLASCFSGWEGDGLTISGAVGAAVVLTLVNPAGPLSKVVADPSPPLVGTPTAGVVTSTADAASPV